MAPSIHILSTSKSDDSNHLLKAMWRECCETGISHRVFPRRAIVNTPAPRTKRRNAARYKNHPEHPKAIGPLKAIPLFSAAPEVAGKAVSVIFA